MRYVVARLQEDSRDMTYRFYIADSLQNIPQNKYIGKRLYDIMYPKQEDTRSGDEIAADVINRLGLKFGG